MQAATDSNFTTSEELDLSLDYLSSIALNAGTPEEFRPFYKVYNQAHMIKILFK